MEYQQSYLSLAIYHHPHTPMSISSNSIRRHLVAASCAMGAAATACYYAASNKDQVDENNCHNNNNKTHRHHHSVSVSPAARSALAAASNDTAFWVATSLLQDPFVRTTLAEPSSSGLSKAKKRLTKSMTLQEKWEYFTLQAINPGEDDDDDDDEDVSTCNMSLVIRYKVWS